MAKIEKMFGAILKDQEQKSDELRDKTNSKRKKLKNLPNAKKPKSNSPTEKRSSGSADADPELFCIRFFSVKRERACPRLHQAQRV